MQISHGWDEVRRRSIWQCSAVLKNDNERKVYSSFRLFRVAFQRQVQDREEWTLYHEPGEGRISHRMRSSYRHPDGRIRPQPPQNRNPGPFPGYLRPQEGQLIIPVTLLEPIERNACGGSHFCLTCSLRLIYRSRGFGLSTCCDSSPRDLFRNGLLW